MAVITISRQFGAGGRTLGAKVAQKLNYLFEDDAIIQEIAKKARKGHQGARTKRRQEEEQIPAPGQAFAVIPAVGSTPRMAAPAEIFVERSNFCKKS